MSRKEREMCIEKESGLSVRHQCVLLGLCRGTLYYTPSMESEENLRIMELLDKTIHGDTVLRRAAAPGMAADTGI